MKKFLIIAMLFIAPFNSIFAQELVLSDRIREAREAQFKQQMKEKFETSMKPVKNETQQEKQKEQPIEEIKKPL